MRLLQMVDSVCRDMFLEDLQGTAPGHGAQASWTIINSFEINLAGGYDPPRTVHFIRDHLPGQG